MISIAELLAIQNVSSNRSKEPGILVIPKDKLARLIQEKLNKTFTRKHLNTALRLYCRRGYAIKMNLGKKKYNLIAEKVPMFIEWFFEELTDDFYNQICLEYENRSIAGACYVKRRGQPKDQPQGINSNPN